VSLLPSSRCGEDCIEGALDALARFIGVVEHVEPVLAVRYIDDVQLGAAASCPCDERIDGGSNRRPFTPNSGQHDRQGSCCGYRFDGLVTLLDHRTRKGRQNRLGCHCAAQPGGRCAQPVRQQQPAAREEPDGDPIGIHPRIAPRQLDSGSHIEGSEGISATSCS
jgi:hypothetical protein